MPAVTASRSIAAADRDAGGCSWHTQPTLLAMMATADSSSPIRAQSVRHVSVASCGTRRDDPTGAVQPATLVRSTMAPQPNLELFSAMLPPCPTLGTSPEPRPTVARVPATTPDSSAQPLRRRAHRTGTGRDGTRHSDAYG